MLLMDSGIGLRTQRVPMLQCSPVAYAVTDTQSIVVFPKTRHIGNNLAVALVLHLAFHMLWL